MFGTEMKPNQLTKYNPNWDRDEMKVYVRIEMSRIPLNMTFLKSDIMLLHTWFYQGKFTSQ